MNKKQVILGLLCVVVGGAAIAKFAISSNTGPDLAKKYDSWTICMNCNHEATSSHALAERPPFVCDSCGQQAAYPWYYCPRCDKRFVPMLTPTSDGTLPVIPRFVCCPSCGAECQAWFPFDDNEEPPPDLPLQEWPIK